MQTGIGTGMRGVVFATALLLSGGAGAVQFSQVPAGPESAPVDEFIAVGAATRYVAVSDRIYKTVNSGAAWTLLPAPPASPRSLAFTGGALFIETRLGMFRSGDDGATWTAFDGTGAGALPQFNGPPQLFAAGTRVYVSGFVAVPGQQQAQPQLFRSAAGAPAWSQATPPGLTEFIGQIVRAGTTTCARAGNAGVRFTTDDGTTWQTSGGAGGNFTDLHVAPSGTVFLLQSSGLRQSTNNCASFTTLAASGLSVPGAQAVAVGVSGAGDIYVGFTNGNVMRSTDGGASFVADNSGALPAATGFAITDLVQLGTSILAATSGPGVMSRASGTWQPSNSGLKGAAVGGMLAGATAGSLIVGTSGGVLLTGDAGATFTAANVGLDRRPVRALVSNGTTVLAGLFGTAQQPPGLFRSTDSGATWTHLQTTTGLPLGSGFDSLVRSGTVFIGATTAADDFNLLGVYRSTDDGVTWTKSNTGLPANPFIRNLAVTSNNDVYAYVANVGVFRSTDGGQNWTATGALTGSKFGKVFAAGSTLIASAGGVVHRSTDSGANWNPTTGFAISQFGIELLSLVRDGANALYLGDEHAGLSISKDDGQTWVPDSDGLAASGACIERIERLVIQDGKVFAGQGEGGGVRVANPIGGAVPGDSVACTTNIDIFPDNFSFAAQNNAAPSTLLQSSSSISGLGTGVTVPVSVAGGEYQVGCTGAFTSADGVIGNGPVCVRHTSAATGETATTTTLTVGNRSAVFVSRTGLVFTGRADEINTSFGTGGFASASGIGEARDTLILADGRIAAAGIAGGFADPNFGMALFNADGSPVTTFGTNGVVSVNLGGNDLVVKVLALPGGKFMLVGTTVNNNGTPTNGGDDFNLFGLVRLNANGTPDTTFGPNGVVTFDVRPSTPSNYELAGDAALLADGSILVVGAISTSGAGTQYVAVKFSQDGVADPNFGGDDPLFANGVANSGPMGTTSISAGGVAVQSTGKFVVAGTRQPDFTSVQGVAVRFNADGTFDTGFGVSGVRVIPTSTGLEDAVLAAGDKIVLAGRATIANFFRPLVARLNADGTLDTGFAGDGVFSLDTVSGLLLSAEVVAGGKVAAIGNASMPDASSQLLHLRLTAAGALDNTFGPNGQGFLTRGPVNGAAVTGASTALLADGGLLVGGTFNNTLGLFVFGGQAVAPGDTTPDPFTFTDQGGVATSTVIVSNAITVSGIDAPAPISVSGGEYSIGAGAFTSQAGTVTSGQTVRVRHTSSAAPATATSTALTIGGVSDTFTSTTAAAADTAPDAFTFTDQTGVEPLSQVTSNAITVGGINTASPIGVTGGTYSIDGGAFVTQAGAVNNGQQVRVRHTASVAFGTAVNTVLTIGGVADTFTSTTRAADVTPDNFAFTDQTGVATATQIVSNSITVSGIEAAVPISVTGGEYSVNGGAFTSQAGTVTAGQQVRVRHTSAATASTAVNTVLSIGPASDTFTSTTAAPNVDTTPEQFAFQDQGNVATGSVVTSNAITVSGINAPAAISVIGGEYSIGAGAFTAQAGTVTNGQMVRVRHTAAAQPSTITSTVLTIDTVFDTFTSTTAAPQADTTPDPFHFNDQTGAAPNSQVNSNAITVAGINAAVPVSIQGGEYSVDNGAFTTAAGTVSNGQTVRVRLLTRGFATTSVATLSIGEVGDAFSVVTASASSTGSVTDRTGANVGFGSSTGTLVNLQRVVEPAGAPDALDYPNGFFSFDLTGLANGATATVVLTLPAAARPTSYVKCSATACAVFAGAVIHDNIVSLILTDGGAGDGDGVANGVIHDPGAPAVPAASAAASASSGGAVAPALLLALLGVIGLRRRRIALN
ncbi:MAG TPA: choice-of-anchor U domain-containing protein [Solimonas sp.]|nr:choice-of-anchor U domain-containing protein [Solimonas sp.]